MPNSTSSKYTLSTCCALPAQHLYQYRCRWQQLNIFNHILALKSNPKPHSSSSCSTQPTSAHTSSTTDTPKKPAQCAASMHCNQGCSSTSTVEARGPPTAAAVVVLALCICVCAAHRGADNTPGCRHLQHILYHCIIVQVIQHNLTHNVLQGPALQVP